MNEYVIVTDSTADLPLELYDELKLEVVPMEYFVNGKAYKHFKNSRELKLSEFYKKLKEGEKVTTTQINPFIYESVFEPILKNGKDILYLCFSSGLSGTYQVAKSVSKYLSEKYKGRRILCIDTLCASCGEGLLAYYAANLKMSGKTLDEVYDWVNNNKLKIAHWFIVNDLEHLKQGGRITSLQANLGMVLNLKPVISLDSEGKLIPISKQRGEKRAIEELIRRLVLDGENIHEQTVMIAHASNPDAANVLCNKLKGQSLVKNVIISEIGPIIGTHVGAGMFGLTFLGTRSLNK